MSIRGQTVDDWFKMMSGSENFMKLESGCPKKLVFVWAHDRYEAVTQFYDRTCIAQFVVQDKWHAKLLIKRLQKDQICWVTDRPRERLPCKIATFEFIQRCNDSLALDLLNRRHMEQVGRVQ